MKVRKKMAEIEIVIKIPEGLKKDFELEQWTALSCMEMKDALMNGTPLPKGHGRLKDADNIKTAFPSGEYVRTESVRATIDHEDTIIEADKEESEG